MSNGDLIAMKLLQKIWGWIRIDGLLHFALSALIVIVIATFAPVWVAVALTFTAGTAKEFQDMLLGGKFSLHDLICNMSGIALGALFSYFVF